MAEFSPESEPVSASEPGSSRTAAEPLSFTNLTGFLGLTAAATEEIDALPPGTCVGDVRIVRPLGAGGMGCVYEGFQEPTRRAVAVKLLRAGVVSLAAGRRFAQEARILGQLAHPGIARIYSADVARIGGRERPFLVMEYVEEPRSITAYAAEESLSERDRVELFQAACLAVAHGHQQGVVHRDLKPGNMLVDARGRPKIIDFGVARSAADDGQLTTMHTGTGELLGTAQYMAPEQLLGTGDSIDARADVYALGLVCYEMLTGSLPYDVRNRPVYEVARIVQEAEPRSQLARNRRLGSDLTAIIATCLEKDPARRYPSAAELAADLERYLAGIPIIARPPGLAESLIRLASRYRTAAIAAIALVVTLAAAAVGMSILAARAEQARAKAAAAAELATRQLYRANIRSMQSFLDAGNVRAARSVFTADPAGEGSAPGLEFRCLRADLDDALVVLRPTGNPVVAVAYSADGQRLDVTTPILEAKAATSGSRGQFAAEARRYRAEARRRPAFWKRANRRQTTRYRISAGDRYGLAGDPADGQGPALDPRLESGQLIDRVAGRSLIIAPDGRVMLTGAAAAAVPLGEARRRLRKVAFGPGGDLVAILDAAGHLELWDAAAGSFRVRSADDHQVDSFVFSPDGSRLALIGSRGEIDVVVLATGSGREALAIQLPEPAGLSSSDDVLVAFDHDGRQMAVSAASSVISIWNAETGILEKTLDAGAAIVTALAWNPGGDRIASGDASGRIVIWDTIDGSLEETLHGHDDDVLGLAFSPSGQRLASGGMDGTARIWAATMPRPLDSLPLAAEPVAVAFHPAGGELAVATARGEVAIWRTRRATRRLTLPGGGSATAAVRYSPDGSLLAVTEGEADTGGRVRIHETATGRELARLEEPGERFAAAIISPDNARVVTTSTDSVVAVWSLDGPKRLWGRRNQGSNDIFNPPALFGDGGEVVVCRQPALLDPATGRVRQAVKGGMVSCLAVGPSGQQGAFGTPSGQTWLFDCRSGRSQARLVGYSATVLALGFSPDGGRLVTGSDDGTARLWDATSGTQLHRFDGHEAAVEMACLTRDGRRVVTASRDGTVRIWDAVLGVELCQFPLEVDRPDLVVVSPDDAILAVPGIDMAGSFLRLRGLSNAEIVAARHAPLANADR